MRYTLLVAVALAGCGGPSDELVEREFRTWCGQTHGCRPAKEVKSIERTKGSEMLQTTKIVFVRGWDTLSVGTARCTFEKPRKTWKLKECRYP
jgi:hypothetical protein